MNIEKQMITFFSVPKPFKGHIDIIQRNAIQSWKKLGSNCEIVLLGDEYGVSDVSKELNVLHISTIKKNTFGTPLIDSIFEIADKMAMTSFLCYINTDIILFNNFLTAFNKIHFNKFLMVGQRWDVNITFPINFSHADWETQLTIHLDKFGHLHGCFGIDYFLFTKGLWSRIPAFALGRTKWDNWLIYKAVALGASVVDATTRFGSGMRVKIINAMYRGLPVLTTSKGVEGINAKDMQHLLVSDNAQKMIKDAETLLSNKILWEEIRDQSRKYVKKHYTWEKVFQNIDKALR